MLCCARQTLILLLAPVLDTEKLGAEIERISYRVPP